MKLNLKKNGILTILLALATLIGCTNKTENKKDFTSDFRTSGTRTWIGPEYWSNPLQDWQVSNGYLECLVSNRNRNVHILTHQLDSSNTSFAMRVAVKLFNIDGDPANKNWVGFSIGSKGVFDDYRDDAVFGKGLNLGITTNGNLFIDEINNNELNIELQKQLVEGAVLELYLKSQDHSNTLILKLLNADSEIISEIEKPNIRSERLVGDLVLMSHYNFKRNDPLINKKSVAFKDWMFSGDKITMNSKQTFGPILFSQYTLSKGVLKLTAQMAPVLIGKEKVHLEILENDDWTKVEESEIDPMARTATFKIPWVKTKTIPYRLSFKMDRGLKEKETHYWEGQIRKDPIEKEELVVAGFTGNSDLGFPDNDITNQIKYHDPDVLFFSGDQIYESVGGYGAQRAPLEKATLDYLRKWYLYGWAFRDLMKDRPTISITDDHDVYHGNIWGSGGRKIPAELGQGAKAQDYGGYKMPATWVKMVERTQTSHLPDPYHTESISQGLTTYYTDMVYGEISFAILEDRKFKSAPKALLPEAQITNGWAQNKNFNMATQGDVPTAHLLGKNQMDFLKSWATDWSHKAQMKLLLSQTIFTNVATLPKKAMSGAIIPTLRILNKDEYPPDDRPVADLDSNGWPQNKRDEAIRAIRKGFTFHLAGDQHLGSTVHYGVENWNDSGYALCVPSISNYWPRRWYPLEKGNNRNPNLPKYTGEYLDGFGNKMTVYAASNPLFSGLKPSRLYDRAAGYGIVRMNKKNRTIKVECWPRQGDPTKGDQEQYDGWPIIVSQADNYGRSAQGHLPEIKTIGIQNPVIEIIEEINNTLIYALRINTNTFKAKVFDANKSYKVRVGEPDTNQWKEQTGIRIQDTEPLQFSFDK